MEAELTAARCERDALRARVSGMDADVAKAAAEAAAAQAQAERSRAAAATALAEACAFKPPQLPERPPPAPACIVLPPHSTHMLVKTGFQLAIMIWNAGNQAPCKGGR